MQRPEPAHQIIQLLSDAATVVGAAGTRSTAGGCHNVTRPRIRAKQIQFSGMQFTRRKALSHQHCAHFATPQCALELTHETRSQTYFVVPGHSIHPTFETPHVRVRDCFNPTKQGQVTSSRNQTEGAHRCHTVFGVFAATLIIDRYRAHRIGRVTNQNQYHWLPRSLLLPTRMASLAARGFEKFLLPHHLHLARWTSATIVEVKNKPPLHASYHRQPSVHHVPKRITDMRFYTLSAASFLPISGLLSHTRFCAITSATTFSSAIARCTEESYHHRLPPPPPGFRAPRNDAVQTSGLLAHRNLTFCQSRRRHRRSASSHTMKGACPPGSVPALGKAGAHAAHQDASRCQKTSKRTTDAQQ